MLFHSGSFLIFFPIVALAYFLVPRRAKHLWLLAASYFFYMCWNAKYALLIALSTLITYASGLLIHWKRKRLWVFLSFASNLAILFFFKYFGFFLDNLSAALALAAVRNRGWGYIFLSGPGEKVRQISSFPSPIRAEARSPIRSISSRTIDRPSPAPPALRAGLD